MLDAGSVMLALTLNSGLIAFKPSGQAYTELAKLKVSESETWAHPWWRGKRIYVKDADSVNLLDFWRTVVGGDRRDWAGSQA